MILAYFLFVGSGTDFKVPVKRARWPPPKAMWETTDTPCEYATPFAELEAVADMGDKQVPVKILSPILSAEVARLLKLPIQK
jgi:hypothetical protein